MADLTSEAKGRPTTSTTKLYTPMHAAAIYTYTNMHVAGV